VLKIDRKTGLITTDDGRVVFDPRHGPKLNEWPRPMSFTKLFEGCAEDETKVLVHLREVPGDLLLQFAADHPKFGSNWSDWSVEKEMARMEWLKEFLVRAGAPVGTYSWGKVSAASDARSARA
jgi:hypothetical protein